MWIEVPLKGSGTTRDPFEPDIPRPIPFSTASWPTDRRTGRPLVTHVLVWIPDHSVVPPRAKVLARTDALVEIVARDPKLNVDHVEKGHVVR